MVHVVVQPKTWFGQAIAAVVGVAVLLAMFFLSIIVFAVLASVGVVVALYLWWMVRRARRRAADNVIDNVIDNEAKNPDPR